VLESRDFLTSFGCTGFCGLVQLQDRKDGRTDRPIDPVQRAAPSSMRRAA